MDFLPTLNQYMATQFLPRAPQNQPFMLHQPVTTQQHGQSHVRCSPSSSELAEHSSVWLLNIQFFNPSAHNNSKWKVSYLTDELNREQIKNHTVPFIALTETWLKPSIKMLKFAIPGYNLLIIDSSNSHV